MGSIRWDFPLLGTGNQGGSNIAAITLFKGIGIMDGLAREICQNSLDAKNKNLPDSVPVIVAFELIELDKRKYRDFFDGYEEAVKNSRAFWEANPLKTQKIMDFIASLEDALKENTVPMLVISDRNTKGLNGVDVDPDKEKSFWNLMVNTDGISIKDDENSGGSFGIGKNAPFAYSALNLICYNTLAEDGGRGFEGVTRLVTTQVLQGGELKKTQPIGKYLFMKNEYEGRPILPGDNCSIANLDIFRRHEGDIGTDVAIVGFKVNEHEDWERSLAIALIKNFILAIYNGKLEVSLVSPKLRYEISKEKLENLLYKTFEGEPQLKSTRQIYETLLSPDKIHTLKIAEDGDLSFYIKYGENYSPTLSRFRSMGMLINTTNEVFPHYSVVLLVNDVGSLKLSKTLKEAEPIQHTEWRGKHVTNPTLRNRANKYIREIRKRLQKCLDEFDGSTISDKIDAGIGDFLPDSSDSTTKARGNDELRKDLKIKEIKTRNGRVLYKKEYESAKTATGEKVDGTAVKTGKRRNKPGKIKPGINRVKPGTGDNMGVAPGEGKLKIVSPIITDHRTFYLRGNKYRLILESPASYQNVYIQYFAGKDDDNGEDSLSVKNVKLDGKPLMSVNGNKIGPVILKEGLNTIHIEFTNNEVMSVSPVFTMEVPNES